MMTVEEYLNTLPKRHVLRRLPIETVREVAQRQIEMLNSPEYLAKAQQEEADRAEREAIKADAFIQNFITMTPQQVEAYINANTASLAQVRALMVKLSLMLLALARREYR